jgi:hypothetical protein
MYTKGIDPANAVIRSANLNWRLSARRAVSDAVTGCVRRTEPSGVVIILKYASSGLDAASESRTVKVNVRTEDRLLAWTTAPDFACDTEGCWRDGEDWKWGTLAGDQRCNHPEYGDGCSLPETSGAPMTPSRSTPFVEWSTELAGPWD